MAWSEKEVVSAQFPDALETTRPTTIHSHTDTTSGFDDGGDPPAPDGAVRTNPSSRRPLRMSRTIRHR